MASIDSLRTLLVEELRDLYDAEKQLTKAIPKLANASTNDELRAGLEAHLKETHEHVARLDQAFDLLDERPKAKPCAGMRGLIDEGDDHAKEDYDDDALRDATIIGAAQRVEHYEMAAYGTAIAHAQLLNLDDVQTLLEQTLGEEKAADRKLSDIAQTAVNVQAEDEGEQGEGREGVAMGAARRFRRASGSSSGAGGARNHSNDSRKSKRPGR